MLPQAHSCTEQVNTSRIINQPQKGAKEECSA
jgi:hypothetical protein